MSTYWTERDKKRIPFLLGALTELAANLKRLADAEIESSTLTGEISEAMTEHLDDLRKLLCGDDLQQPD